MSDDYEVTDIELWRPGVPSKPREPRLQQILATPESWFRAGAVIKLKGGGLSKPGVRPNVIQRRIFAYYASCYRRGVAARGIGLKPRKRGFSTAVSACHYWQMMTQQAWAVAIGHGKMSSAETLKDMVRTYAENDPFLEFGAWGSPGRYTTERLAWKHLSKFEKSTAESPDDIRSKTPQAIHGTEVAFWGSRDAETDTAASNALPDDEFVSQWYESTPNGAAGMFFHKFREARWPHGDECPGGAEYWREWEMDMPEKPDGQWVRIFAAWFEFDDAGQRLAEDEKRQIRDTIDAEDWYQGEQDLIDRYGNDGPQGRRLGREVEDFDVWEQLAWRRAIIDQKCGKSPKTFDQEYPRDPSSCFLASGEVFFDREALQRIRIAAAAAHWEYGQLDWVDGSRLPKATWRTVKREDAVFWQIEQPKVGCSYIIPCDFMRGEDETKGDNPDAHSVPVLRAPFKDSTGAFWRARVVARIFYGCRFELYALTELIRKLSFYYGAGAGALVVPEVNAIGQTVIKRLMDPPVEDGVPAAAIPPIYSRMDVDPKSGIVRNRKKGWETNEFTRQDMLDRLHLALRKDILQVECPYAAHEFASFVKKYKPKSQRVRIEARAGEHDDDVIAIGIGTYLLDAATPLAHAPVDYDIPSEIKALGYGSKPNANTM